MNELVVAYELEKLVFVADVSSIECEEVGHDRGLPQAISFNVEKLLILLVRVRFKKIIKVKCCPSGEEEEDIDRPEIKK